MNRSMIHVVPVVLLGALLQGCGGPAESPPAPAPAAAVTDTGLSTDSAATNVAAVIFSYREAEPGIESYDSRVVVTADYLRMDEGADSDASYLVFDRKDKTIYSVSAENQTVLRIPRRTATVEIPAGVSLGVRSNPVDDMPSMAGEKPVHTTYLSGVQECYNVISVKSMLPDAVVAYREYLLTLAGEQMENLEKTPVDMRQDCMMANLVYQPVRHLESGLPIREWDYSGYSRELSGLQEASVDVSIFRFDPAYRVVELSGEGMQPATTP